MEQTQLDAVIPGARLGIDFGKARTGVAHAASGSSLALPVVTLRSDEQLMVQLAEILAQYQVTLAYVGMPKLLSGKYGEAARMAMQFARELKNTTPELRIRLIDERLTTVSASQKLAAAGVASNARRAHIDQQAAAEILSQALEIESRQGRLAGTEFF